MSASTPKSSAPLSKEQLKRKIAESVNQHKKGNQPNVEHMSFGASTSTNAQSNKKTVRNHLRKV